jgi:hypothetical protein
MAGESVGALWLKTRSRERMIGVWIHAPQMNESGRQGEKKSQSKSEQSRRSFETQNFMGRGERNRTETLIQNGKEMRDRSRKPMSCCP